MPRCALALVALAAFGCDPGPTREPTAAPAEQDGAPPPLTPLPEPADATGDAEREQQAARIAEAIEALEASYAAERRRWTPRLHENAERLVQTVYPDIGSAIDAVLASPHRVPGNPRRDEYRHPKQTLLFFGLRQDMRVVEMFPGGGWYTELVAPLLANGGELVVPAYDPKGPPHSSDTYVGRGLELLLGKSNALFGAVERVPQEPDHPLDLGPAGSADMVLAIREMHNWVRFGNWDEYLAATHAVLVPGGVLAVVQHRAPAGANPQRSAHDGYLPEPWVIEAVEAAGFKLQDKSDLNANPKDTKDYPGGVWMLPPTLRTGAQDPSRYLAIGESDRMTLRFVKL